MPVIVKSTGRIIPARAGFTRTRTDAEPTAWDHPRSRGVYKHRSFLCPSRVGSSPLARGLPIRAPPPGKRVGIIPARAGFTAAPLFCADSLADHPRSRGVYDSLALELGDQVGSSPLARGLQGCSRPLNCWAGIIPARAGFTVRPGSSDGSGEDHPRSRGVYSFVPSDVEVLSGSSPLARGLLDVGLFLCVRRRIIPARAGFTMTNLKNSYGRSDHPRSRGVYCVAVRVSDGAPGSSPLARGLHLQILEELRKWGIIPARAGFTD